MDLLNADVDLSNHVGDLIIVVADLTITRTLLYFRTALPALFKYGYSVFQRIGDGGHDAQFLDVGGVLVAVFDFELPLACRLYLA